jgi:serine/threonine protein kinase
MGKYKKHTKHKKHKQHTKHTKHKKHKQHTHKTSPNGFILFAQYARHTTQKIMVMLQKKVCPELGKGTYNTVYKVPFLNLVYRTPNGPLTNADVQERETLRAIVAGLQNDPNGTHLLCLPILSQSMIQQVVPRWTIKFYPRCNGDLTKMAQSKPPFDQLRQVLIDMLQGVLLLHRIGFGHFDIKPDNVMIRYDTTLQRIVYQLADFGHSGRFGCPNTMGYRGTPGYRPKEHEIEEGGDNDVLLSPPADAHAIAVFILVMAFGKYLPPDQWEEMYLLVDDWKANKHRVRSQLLNLGWTTVIVDAVLKGLSDMPGRRTTVEEYMKLFRSA